MTHIIMYIYIYTRQARLRLRHGEHALLPAAERGHQRRRHHLHRVREDLPQARRQGVADRPVGRQVLHGATMYIYIYIYIHIHIYIYTHVYIYI